jgi:hypothetical protein
MAFFSNRASSQPGGTARRAVQEASPWIRRLARLGYTAIGVVYVVVGTVAARAAFSGAGQPEGSSSALGTIYDRPLGRVGLAIVAVGLFGYAIWRAVSAFFDSERKGTDLKGRAVRLGYLGSALLYTSLGVEAVRLLMGAPRQGSSQGDQQADHWTALVLSQPLGRWVVGIAGVGIILFGLYQIYRGVAGDIRKRLDLYRASPATADNVVRFGRFGHVARGIVFGIIGWFLGQAALRFDPEEAKDLAAALQVLRSQPYGPWLLGAVGLGLISWGVWQLANARYRRIRPT